MKLPESIRNEFFFITSRSGGPGGQNVNKVESKVELRFDILNSIFLTESQKKIILDKLKGRITNNGILILQSDAQRTQSANRQSVTEKFFQLIEAALKTPKKRIKTKPTKASIEERILRKKKRSESKRLRKKDWEI